MSRSRPMLGMAEIEHLGQRPAPFNDNYHRMIALPWPWSLSVLATVYFAFNAIFALLYLLGGDCFGADNPGSYLEAFAFSVQTMSGIGYGAMSPQTPYAHVVSILEAFCGLL